MLHLIKRFFQEGRLKALTDRINSSMGLKFVIALTAVITILMCGGTFLISRMILSVQERALAAHGQEMGRFLGRAGTEPLLHRDLVALDGLVADVVKTDDLLYSYVTGTRDEILTNRLVSFNQDVPAVQKFLARSGSGADMAALAAAARKALDPIEVQVPISDNDAALGSVTLGFSRAGVWRETARVILLLVGLGVIIIIPFAAMVLFMVRRMIVIPTQESVQIASNIAAGDLTQSVRVRSVDEIGMLGRGLNRMIIGLKGMITNVQEAARKTEEVRRKVGDISQEITTGSKTQSESVEEAASSVNEMHFALKEIGGSVQELFATSERTSSSVIEVAASIQEVARTMADLSASIEETSTAISQMSAAVRLIAENASVLSTAAEDTAASATEISASVREVESHSRESASLAEAVATDAQELGMRAIEKTLEGMGRIESTARRTADVVNTLGERAESIGGILTVIEDITDQTSLLALNAAILAAQAGEHGKGFAVVAAEIRELANRTAASTKEIAGLIVSVQEESREAVAVMGEEVTLAGEGLRLAHDAKAALEKILERADLSRDMSKSINKAAEEQTRGMRQVSSAVDKISEMTRQIAHAAQEQKGASEQIMRASERMRDMTRFVKNSTDEQAKGGKDISAAVENMNAKVGMVHRAAGEVQAGSDLIVKAIERIKEIAKASADQAAVLHGAMDGMTTQAEALRKELGQFRT